jgi:hypothetical protein
MRVCLNRPRLKHHMDYCMEHPEELSRVAGLQKKVDEVKNVMVDNIEQACGVPCLFCCPVPALRALSYLLHAAVLQTRGTFRVLRLFGMRS